MSDINSNCGGKLSQNVIVKIDGIDMEFEVWELVRLFFNAESIFFYNSDGEIKNNSFDEPTFPADLLIIKVDYDEEKWLCRVFFYNSITKDDIDMALKLSIKPQYYSEKAVSHHELNEPGGSVLKSRKIVAGSLIVDVLSGYTNRILPYGALIGIRPVKLAMQCLNDGMNESDTVKHLVRASGINEEKASLLYNIAKVEKPLIEENKRAVHLYVGIPFCLSRCLYCSFTSYPISRYKDMVSTYLNALKKEIRHFAHWTEKYGFNVASVYVGGGTPTSIDAESLSELLSELNSNFDTSRLEFTVEAGRPDSITRDKLEALKRHNVSRISINPQTMNDETLKRIGRNHTSRDIEESFHMARQLGFNNINMDIIAGLPGEDEEMFSNTLRRIEEFSPESLTVHTMSLKRASRLMEEQESFSSTSDEIVESMINMARNSAYRMGMRPYYLYRQKNILANLENTGYAKPGYECLYNIHTMEERQTILAFGAGAISKFVFAGEKKIERLFNIKDVALYIERIDEILEKKDALLTEYVKTI